MEVTMSKPALPLALAIRGVSVTPEAIARREQLAHDLDAVQIVAALREGETNRARAKRLRNEGRAQ